MVPTAALRPKHAAQCRLRDLLGARAPRADPFAALYKFLSTAAAVIDVTGNLATAAPVLVAMSSMRANARRYS
jgi:hypothetical protein